MRIVNLWDGEKFFQAPEDEAKKLIAEDKAQSEAEHGYSHFKYRHQFTGYVTRELRAKAPVKVEPVPDESDAEVKVAIDWRTYRKKVGKLLGKAVNRVTKKDVEDYLDGNV